MDQIKCTNCGTWNPKNREHCINCNNPLEEKKYKVTGDDQRQQSLDRPITQVNAEDSSAQKTKKRMGVTGMIIFFVIISAAALVGYIFGI